MSRTGLALLMLTALGCTSEVTPSEVTPFEGAAASLGGLASGVLDALSREDLAALEAVRLTEREHNEVVWPELPASAPELNFPVDFAWSNIQTRNQSALARIDDYYRGRELTLVGAECRGERQTFEVFDVLTDCWVSFKADGESTIYEAQVFKDVIVRSGGHKIFRYYDEQPRRRDVGMAP